MSGTSVSLMATAHILTHVAEATWKLVIHRNTTIDEAKRIQIHRATLKGTKNVNQTVQLSLKKASVSELEEIAVT